MTVSIRLAQPSDAPAIAEVLLASRAAFLPYAPSPHSDDSVRGFVRVRLLPSQKVTVAVMGSTVIGVIAVRHDGKATWITQLYLHPAHVGRGVGTLLLGLALAEEKHPIRLYTFQAYTGARRFYECNGFVPIAFGDGAANEEHCQDVLFECA